MQEMGITLMLAGNMGMGAYNKLSAHGIAVVRGCHGKVDDVLDRDLGKVGTPKRDEFERKVDESVHAYRLGLEKGYSITIPTMSRVFKALGIATATLDLGSIGKVALW